MKIDFATFCHPGDAHRLHAPGQFKRQVESNNYPFDLCHIIYQGVDMAHYVLGSLSFPLVRYGIYDIDWELQRYGIDIHKEQYVSPTDRGHFWKYHVVNHIVAAQISGADYIVLADNDCWMVRQPPGLSWVNRAIEILEQDPTVFIVSPNDGEPERKTTRFSQQMFMTRTKQFRRADFNQPGWDGNVNVPGGPIPEYWGMLEGRMEIYCRTTGQCRYVLGPEYRYYHHNRLTKDGLFETDISKY